MLWSWSWLFEGADQGLHSDSMPDMKDSLPTRQPAHTTGDYIASGACPVNQPMVHCRRWRGNTALWYLSPSASSREGCERLPWLPLDNLKRLAPSLFAASPPHPPQRHRCHIDQFFGRSVPGRRPHNSPWASTSVDYAIRQTETTTNEWPKPAIYPHHLRVRTARPTMSKQ